MQSDTSRAIVPVGASPIYPLLLPFPVVCFFGTFATDLIYWRTAAMQWETFSVWLLTAGMIMAGFVVIGAIIDLLRSWPIHLAPAAWLYIVGNAVVLILSLINAFVHSRDGYTSVVPTGLFLSTLVVLILIFTSWLGRSLICHHGVRVAV